MSRQSWAVMTVTRVRGAQPAHPGFRWCGPSRPVRVWVIRQGPNLTRGDDRASGATHSTSLKKSAASTALTDPAWTDSEIPRGDLVDAVRRVTEQDGADTLQHGYGRVTDQLISEGMIDEVRFWFQPVLQGGTAWPLPCRAAPDPSPCCAPCADQRRDGRGVPTTGRAAGE